MNQNRVIIYSTRHFYGFKNEFHKRVRKFHKKSINALFSGIVQGTAQISKVKRKDNFSSFHIIFPNDQAKNVLIGSSIAINGTCLTVRSIEDNTFVFDAIIETLQKTNLGTLKIQDYVNFETYLHIIQ